MRGCGEWQERIALAAGDDLIESERAELDRHVAECAPCAEELAAIHQSLARLREAHEEPITEAHFAVVRARVMAHMDARRRVRWEWVASLTAALAAVAGLVWLRPAPVRPPPIMAVAAPPAPLSVPRVGLDRSLPVAAPKQARIRARACCSTARERSSVPTEPVVVKLITDDPNVVIYWIGDSQ